jgi:hypothetical protein
MRMTKHPCSGRLLDLGPKKKMCERLLTLPDGVIGRGFAFPAPIVALRAGFVINTAERGNFNLNLMASFLKTKTGRNP